MLPGFEASLVCRLLAEPQEATDQMPELGESLVICNADIVTHWYISYHDISRKQRSALSRRHSAVGPTQSFAAHCYV